MPPPIGIAFVVDTIQGPTAGTENQILRIIKRLDRNYFRPYLVVLQSSPFLDNEWTDCEVHCLGIHKLFSCGAVLATLQFVKYLRNNEISIVQTFFRDSMTIGILAASLAHSPVRLSSKRNLGYADTEISKSKLQLSNMINRLADYYVVNGLKVKEHYTRVQRLSPDKIRIFYNLVDEGIRVENKDRPHLRNSLGIQPSDIVFLVVANLRPVKGHAFLVESVRSIGQRIPNARFVLVGGGPANQELSQTDVYRLVASKGLSDRFVFTGLQSDVKPYLGLADVGMLCSSSEGFSGALLEYTAAGLPCIATQVGSNEEIVIDGVNGFLVPYGEVDRLAQSILALYSDKNLRQKMGENSRLHFLRNFEPNAQIEKLQQFYMEIVKHY